MAIRSILLAEDDPHIRRVSEIALRRDGFDVHLAGDGEEALSRLEAQRFDLIILDGMMPGLDGLDVCRRIKNDPRSAHVPVIIMSARSQASDQQAGFEAGAIGYICKPFNALSLGAEVRRLCGKGT